MLSEIKIYEIKIEKRKKFLFFFTKKEILDYILTYRIDEDRFWFYKKENNKDVENHLMKQNLINSISTMKNILERFNKFKDYSMKNDDIIISEYSITDKNNGLYELILEYSDMKEQSYQKKENIRKGVFFNNDYDF